MAPEVAPGRGPKWPEGSRTPEASENRAVFFGVTRVDPCIKCTRSKLDSGQVAAGLAASKDLLAACWIEASCLRSCLVSSPLVSNVSRLSWPLVFSYLVS